MTESNLFDVNSYIDTGGSSSRKHNPRRDGWVGDDQPHDFSYDRMKDKFVKYGKNDVEKALLRYFQDELGDKTLTIGSTVFPKPENKMMVALNKLAVRKCLIQSWTRVQDSYPCLDGFEYVVGDADFKYIMEFPYYDMDTGILHGVETVNDFVDFTMGLVVDLCMPCIKPNTWGCSRMVEKMEEAMIKCKEVKCKKSKKKLIEFFLSHVNNHENDIVVSEFDSGFDEEPSSSVGLAVAPGVGFSTGVGLVPHIDTMGLSTPSRMVTSGGGRMGTTRAKFQNKIDLSSHRNSPASVEYKTARSKLLDMYEDSSDPSSTSASNAPSYLTHWKGGELVIDGAIDQDGIDKFSLLPPSERVRLEKEVNETIKKGSGSNVTLALKTIHDYGLEDQYERYEIRGYHKDKGARVEMNYFSDIFLGGVVMEGEGNEPVDEDDWDVKYIVHVNRNRMMVKSMDSLGLLKNISANLTEPSDDQSGVVSNFEGLRVDQLVEDILSSNLNVGTENLTGKVISDEQVSMENAEAWRVALHGDFHKYSPDDRIMASIFLDSDMLAGSESRVTKSLIELSDHASRRAAIMRQDGVDKLDLNIQQGIQIKRHRMDVEGKVLVLKDGKRYRKELDDSNHDEIFAVSNHFDEIRVNTLRYIDNMLPSLCLEARTDMIPGYSRFLAYKNAAMNPDGSRKANPTKQELRMERQAQEAEMTAKVVTIDQRSSQSWYTRVMRHGSFVEDRENMSGVAGLINIFHFMRDKFEKPQEGSLFESNCVKIMNGGLIEDVDDVSFADMVRHSRDVVRHFDLEVGAGLGDIFKTRGIGALLQCAVFIAMYCVSLLSTLKKPKSVRNRELYIMQFVSSAITGLAAIFPGIRIHLLYMLLLGRVLDKGIAELWIRYKPRVVKFPHGIKPDATVRYHRRRRLATGERPVSGLGTTTGSTNHDPLSWTSNRDTVREFGREEAKESGRETPVSGLGTTTGRTYRDPLSGTSNRHAVRVFGRQEDKKSGRETPVSGLGTTTGRTYRDPLSGKSNRHAVRVFGRQEDKKRVHSSPPVER